MKSYLIWWNIISLAICTKEDLTVLTIFSHDGNWERCDARKLDNVWPCSGLCCSASQRPSSTMMHMVAGIFPVLDRVFNGSRIPLTMALLGLALQLARESMVWIAWSDCNSWK